MNSKKIILVATSDLATDQRVNRVANALQVEGCRVFILGRIRKDSLPYHIEGIGNKRLKMIFKRGPQFYAFFNLRCFLFLLFRKFDVVISNDLDTLPGCFLASAIKRKKIVYDSHEYFTEVPELVGRKRIQNAWVAIEKTILPKIKYAYTVCDSIANIYREKYGTDFITIRNLPVKKDTVPLPSMYDQVKNRKIIFYQGALNKGRGLETIIDAMQLVNKDAILLIAGRGDCDDQLKKQVAEKELGSRILFLGSIPFVQLHSYTRMAHLGISLEQNMGLNYYYALPNKLFDYIQARVPVLTSDFPEMKKIVDQYDIGMTIKEYSPQILANTIHVMLNDDGKRKKWILNLEKAANELIWENEKTKLIELFHQNALI